MTTPSTNGPNGGRDQSTGRFAPGWKGGPGGSAYAAKAARLRTALLKAIKPDDLQAVIKAMVDAAKSGDTAAAKLVLAYAVGQPPTQLDMTISEPEPPQQRTYQITFDHRG